MPGASGDGRPSRQDSASARDVRNRLVSPAIVMIALAAAGCGEGGPTPAADPGTRVGFLDSDWTKAIGIAVVAVLIGAAFTQGAFGKLAAVVVAAIVAWVVIAPNLSPELRTPDGPWSLHLAGDKEGDDLLLVNTRCGERGAEGTIVNLGDRWADVVVRTTYSQDEWQAERVDSGLIRVAPGSERRWMVANAPTASEREASCRAAILAARRRESLR